MTAAALVSVLAVGFQFRRATSEQALQTSPACSCPDNNDVADDVRSPFAGLTLNVLGRSFGHDFFMKKVSEWENITGASVRVPVQAKTGAELNDLTWEDMEKGANYYDAYIAMNQNIPTLAHEADPETGEGWILNLDTLVKESPNLDWPGIHSVYREYLCLYNDHIYTLPFDGDQYFLYYRRDLQERDGWEVPKTWDELIRVAEMYEGQDLDGDGEPDYAMCQPNRDGDTPTFYSLYAPLLGLLKTHSESHVDVKKKIFPKRHETFLQFWEDGMMPLVDNAATRRVLPLMKRIYELGKREETKLCCSTKDEGDELNSGHGLYRTGKCAFYFSFPSAGTNSIRTKDLGNGTVLYPFQHGRMGTAELPGWTEYLDRETDTLKPCTTEECPTSVPLNDGDPAGARLNRVSWFANGGMGGIINGRVDRRKQLAAFDLFAYFSRTLDTTKAGMPYNPFRDPGHFRLEDYLGAKWEETDATLYLDAARGSLENPNAAMDLRVPHAPEFYKAYIRHFNQYCNATYASEEEERIGMDEIVASLDEEIRGWLQVHDTRVPSSETYWTGTIEQIYRRSMSLPLREAPETIDHHTIDDVRWVGWTMGAVVIVVSLGFVLWVYKRRETRIVRASQPLFLAMICLGTLIMGASLFPLGVDDSIASQEGCSIACMAWPWLFTCGFTTSFSAVFSKQWRIRQILLNPTQFRRIKVSERDVMLPFAIMLLLNVVLLVSWTMVDPLMWERVQIDALNSYGRCSPQGDGIASAIFFSLIAVVNISALMLANIQAYRCRKICDELSESKFLAIAMACVLEIAIFTLPVAFLVRDNPAARFFVFSVVIFVVAMSLLLLIFVPKLSLMHQRGEKPRYERNPSYMREGKPVSVNSLQESIISDSTEVSLSESISGGALGIRILTNKVENRATMDQTNKIGEYRKKLGTLRVELEEQGINADALLERAGFRLDEDFLAPHRNSTRVSFSTCPHLGDVQKQQPQSPAREEAEQDEFEHEQEHDKRTKVQS